MSQEAVERILGRLITDGYFRNRVEESLVVASLQEGYSLTPMELRLLSGTDLQQIAKLGGLLDPGLCRA